MKYLIYLVFVASIAGLAGCAKFGTTNVAPGGVDSAGIFSRITYPSARETPLVRYTFTHDDIEILGIVEGKGVSVSVLGIVATGDNGFGEMMAQAREKYPNMDGVINIQWDTKCQNVCSGFIYNKVYSSVEAVAMRFKRPSDKK